MTVAIYPHRVERNRARRTARLGWINGDASRSSMRALFDETKSPVPDGRSGDSDRLGCPSSLMAYLVLLDYHQTSAIRDNLLLSLGDMDEVAGEPIQVMDHDHINPASLYVG